MTDVVASVRAHLCTALHDEHPSAASVTFVGLEPVEVLRFGPDDNDLVTYATVGCSRYPMADPNEFVTDPVRGPRAEVLVRLRGGAGTASGIHRTLAVLAASPAVEGVVLGVDRLMDLGEPLWHDSPFSAVLLGVGEIADLPLDPPAEPVQFLEAAPLSATEAAWIRLRGADALREAWREAGIDPYDPERSAASL
ncbi:suppressor of fused domain protein [Aldersonia sp. NBC_00410]|uniref:suppressor of fused domain protein n=1 Tax=Aldersonia sp. NBC_00410 TaxID=2975954 RepID=UPI0022570871|nr:suppressor of fused domain protein [Aldersonia sp. NBC_00410]MCX5043731.1 suppressor of fused domain protein [Aldersonia sp. NBC_00410]